MMFDLNVLWFILVATLFCVYFFLDGKNFGIGMLLPFLGKDEAANDRMLYALGPHWGADEVWLITAGGAMFAAFPGWYATMFSGFYLALFLLLSALIVRAISIEFTYRSTTEKVKKAYRIAIGVSSFLTPLLLAVAIACLLRGTPIDSSFEFTGNLLSLFSPFTLAAGVTAVVYFIYLGAVILDLRFSDTIEKARSVADKTGILALALAVVTLIFAAMETDVFQRPFSAVFAVAAILILLVSYILRRKKTNWVSVLLNGLFVASTIIAVFSAMFPRVMVSATNYDFSLTIYNAASGHYTLSVMTVTTVILLPIVLAYTIWSYYIFAKAPKGKI